MTILIRTLFLSLMMIGSTIFANATPIPPDAPTGIIVDVAQTDLVVTATINRSQLPSQLQNSPATLIMHNAQGQEVCSVKVTEGSVTFVRENLPDGEYTISLRIGQFVESKSFTLVK